MPKPEPPEPTAPGTRIARELSDAVTADDADLLAAALTAVFDQLQPVLDRPKRDLDEGELRGWVGELPVRLMVDYEGHFEVEARIDNMEWAAFEYDPDLVPIVGDPDDPFADSQNIRVFVAKGVYIQADPEAVDRAMQFVAGFAPAVIARISAALGRASQIRGDLEGARDALEAAGTNHEVVVYDAADHGFFCDRRATHHEASAKDAWERVKALFSSELG